MFQKYFMTSIVALLLITNVQAQEEEPKNENSLKAGSWSLLFTVSSNFRLSSFEGSVLSVKKHFSDKRALRLGITLSGNLKNSDVESKNFQDDTLAIRDDRTEDLGGINFGFNSHFLFYPSSNNQINIYWGIGPNLQFSVSKNETNRSNTNNPNNLTTEQTITSISTGLSTILGIEWFATKSISFIAEYGLLAKYIYTKDKRSNESLSREVSTSTIKTFDIDSESVKFGLCAYF